MSSRTGRRRSVTEHVARHMKSLASLSCFSKLVCLPDLIYPTVDPVTRGWPPATNGIPASISLVLVSAQTTMSIAMRASRVGPQANRCGEYGDSSRGGPGPRGLLVDSGRPDVSGGVTLRHALNDFLLRAGGHIGYGFGRLRKDAGWPPGPCARSCRALSNWTWIVSSLPATTATLLPPAQSKRSAECLKTYVRRNSA
jgi:hypothetical protein